MEKKTNPGSESQLSMVLAGIAFGLAYWIVAACLEALNAKEGTFLNYLLGIDSQQIWQRLIVVVFFILIGSHIQYAFRKRHEAEGAVMEAEHRFSELVETSTDAIISTDESLEIVQWNRAASDLFDYKKELALGKPVDFLVPQKYRQRHLDGVAHYLRTGEAKLVGKTVELEGLRKDGTVKPIELSLSESWREGSRIFTAIIRETTERRQALEALRESEERYRNLFEQSKDAILIWTNEGKILGVNQASLDIFGYSMDELIGSDISDIYLNSKDYGAFRKQLENDNHVKGYELELKKKDGARIDCLLTCTVRRGKDRRIFGYQGIVRDVTDQKRNERELKRSLESLRRAMGGIIEAMSLTVESRDPYTAGHQRRVAELAQAIARDMGLSQDRIDGIRMTGIIHDLGKIAVPAEILTKPSELTEKEFDIIKDHPQVGYDILKDIEFPWPVREIILQHHERLDGSGYPNGISGDDIVLEARILAVADVVEAISSHRPYRAALGLDAALKEITDASGTAYDAEVVDVCVKMFKEKRYQFD